MQPVRLPATGIPLILRPLTGAEDLLILEAPREPRIESELALATALAERVAVTMDGAPFSGWTDVPVVDLDVLLLRLRQSVIGDSVRGEVICQAEGCGERVQMSFRISTFLEHISAQTANRSSPDAKGWFAVPGSAGRTRFRLPTPRDIALSAQASNPELTLARRCVHPPTARAGERRRAEQAMEAVAPLRVRDLDGTCPSCGTRLTAHFDIRQFCLREMRELAASLFDEVDLLARTYHWSEASILALSSLRRSRYAERARRHT
jgi:hypothetical protein